MFRDLILTISIFIISLVIIVIGITVITHIITFLTKTFLLSWFDFER
jgi:hypothetical protein